MKVAGLQQGMVLRSDVFYVPFVLFVLFVYPFALADNSSQLAAKVAGEPILISEIEREIAIAYGDRPIAASSKDALRAKVLEQLVKRRLVLHWLAETKQAALPEEVDRAIRQLQQSLTEQDRTLADYLKEQQLDEPGLRRSLAWQIGWQRYIEKQLTDKNLERYFEQHRREFDGTRVRVAHILFKVKNWEEATVVAAARKRAKKVLSQIREGTSFADAARAHSDSPSRDRGGDIGWIGRHEPMTEPFSKAAFALEPNQTSEPVASSFGFHVIHCLEIETGEKQWQDVKPELEKAVVLYLFDWAAEQARPRVQVEYLGMEQTSASSK